MSEQVPGPDLPAQASTVGPAEHPGRRAWFAALAGGIVATALSWAAGEASVGRFQGRAIDPMKEAMDTAEADRLTVKNATLAWGLQGALLGLTLGLAGAASRRQVRAAPVAGLGGLLAGGVLATAGSYFIFTAFMRLANPTSPDMLPSLVSHAGVASLVGAAGGLAFGLGGRGRVARAMLGGLLGAALGSGLYEVLGAVAFPVDRTGEPVAESGPARLLGHALIDLFAALGAAAFVASAGSRAARPPGDRVASAD